MSDKNVYHITGHWNGENYFPSRGRTQSKTASPVKQTVQATQPEDAMSNPTLFSAVLFLITASLASNALAQHRQWTTSNRLVLGTESRRSAAIRICDLNGDAQSDLIVANGRHWPQQNFIFLNQGRARFSVQRPLGLDLSTSYAAEPADLDGDGDVDIAVGNDMAPNQIFLNDGAGKFTEGGSFGEASSLRSLTLADIDQDGDTDILITCRNRPNQIALNDGAGRFPTVNTFGSRSDATIDVAVVDWNGDAHLDLVLANRDDQPNVILLNDGKGNFGPSELLHQVKEPSRAVTIADINADSHPDIIFGNIGAPNRIYFGNGKGGVIESKPFGRNDGRTYTVVSADVDHDGDIDLITGNAGQTNAIYLNQDNGESFTEIPFGTPNHATYGLDVGDLDQDGYPEVVVANSDAPNSIFLNRPAR